MPPSERRPPLAVGTVAALAGAKLLAHLATNLASPYEFHRDEFLYMAMGRHLQLWRMDFPPAIAILSELTRALLGDSLVAVRAAPAVAGALVLVLAAVIARELGGGRGAQALAAGCVLASPLFLRAANLFQPVVLDQLWWTLGLYALARVGRSAAERGDAGSPRWWIALGLAGGVGLLTKFSIFFFGFGVLVALLATPLRRALLGPWPWAAAGIALGLGSPSLVGQLALGAPVVGQMRDLREYQLGRVTAGEFLGGQLLLGPAFVLAVVGAVYLLRSPAARPYRAVGWACAAAPALLLVLHGKPYYAGPVYPALFAAGAVALERWSGARATARAPLVPVTAWVLVALYGALTLPLGLPILPPAPMARYAAALGVTAATRTNTGEQLPLPQDYADMLGWEAQVRTVARVYHALPAGQRAEAVLIADNYGEAGALDFYGPRYGLPPAVAPVGTYWFFGPGPKPGAVVVTLGVEERSLAPYYRAVRPAARVSNPWGVPEEQNVAILVGERPHRTLQAVWPSLAGRN